MKFEREQGGVGREQGIEAEEGRGKGEIEGSSGRNK
jgi:hypothetical protein